MRDVSVQQDIIVGGITRRQRALRETLLIGFLLVSRWCVLHHPIPVHGDEVEFLTGLGFPIPYPVHPPGYPLWIALGTFMKWLGCTPYGGFQFWSVIGSIAAPWLLYRGLANSVADELAWWTALAFGLNPLMWFFSVTALNYTCGVAMGLLVIHQCWKAAEFKGGNSLCNAALTICVCMWLRPDFMAWLGPLIAMTFWSRRQTGGGAWGLLVLTSAAALAGVVMLLYQNSATVSKDVDFRTWLELVYNTSAFKLGFMNGFIRSCTKFFGILTWVFGAAMVLFVYAGFRLDRIRREYPGAISWLLLWTIPLTAFVLLIHMSEPGHIILLVPAGYVLICLALKVGTKPTTAVRIASAIAFCSAIQFLAYPWSADVTGWRRTLNAKIAYLSAAGLRQIDHRWDIHTPSDIWPTEVHQPTASRPTLP